MKRILVPTDFSPVADNALNYAIEIAANFESEILLYHVYTFHRKVDFDEDFPEDEQPFVKNIEKQMDTTKSKFLTKVEQKGLTLKTIVEEGEIFTLFKKKVIKHDISLIVMGSKGASGLVKAIFGSVASEALEMSKVPVMVIPPDNSFHPYKEILLATDLNKSSTDSLSTLQKLAFKFNAEVTVLNVNTDFNKATTQKDNFSLKDVETTFREIPMSKSINESINDFVIKNEFDFMCMIRREKGFFESLFKKSITKTQVYNSKIPLLVLPENKSTTP